MIYRYQDEPPYEPAYECTCDDYEHPHDPEWVDCQGRTCQHDYGRQTHGGLLRNQYYKCLDCGHECEVEV